MIPVGITPPPPPPDPSVVYLYYSLYHVCDLERTQILPYLTLAVLNKQYAGYLLSSNRSNCIDYEENVLWYYTCTKKVSPIYVFEDKKCYQKILI